MSLGGDFSGCLFTTRSIIFIFYPTPVTIAMSNVHLGMSAGRGFADGSNPVGAAICPLVGQGIE